MKAIKFSALLAIIIFLGILNVNAQCSEHSNAKSNDKNQNVSSASSEIRSLKVSGNCEMCQERIQKAALSVKGVKSANWDSNSKILKLSLSSETSLDDVSKAIAAVGHDTEKHKSTDDVYNKLPKCCKYRD